MIAERELAFANMTIEGLLKAMENDKGSRRKEKGREKEKDFVEALVMKKELRATVTGVSMRERRLEKKKQRTGHHRR